MANIVISESEIKKRLGTLSSQSGKVISRAINSSLPTAKRAVANETKKRYYITTSDINKILRVRKSTPNTISADLTYKGEHRNLFLWNNQNAVSPKHVIHWSHGKPNVETYKARVERGHGWSRLGGSEKPFVQHVRKGEKSDFIGLFKRSSSNRNAQLAGVSAPAIPQIIKNKKVIEAFEEQTSRMLDKRLNHEINAVLEGIAK